MFEVNPVTNKLLARRAFALRDLVFVMWKNEIDTAGVNVETLTEILHRHCGTLDVPARPAATDLRVPGRLGFACRFLPQREIARVFFLILVGIDTFARAGDIARKVNL